MIFSRWSKVLFTLCTLLTLAGGVVAEETGRETVKEPVSQLPLTEAAETEVAPVKTPPSQPVSANPSPGLPKNAKLTSVPMPPEKPSELRSVISGLSISPPKAGSLATLPQPAPSFEAVPPEEEEQKSQADIQVSGKIDPTIPLPPQKPFSNLPLPPSMKSEPQTEKDDDGEDEAPSGGYEKQVDSVQLACIKPEVMAIVSKAGVFFRALPVITSGFRANGRRGSLHRKCLAVDFFIPGVGTQTLAKYLRTLPESGGVGTYCHTKSVHIDTGEARNWGYCGFRRTYFSMR